MNDFTKEELIDIYWKYEYYFDDLDGLVEKSPIMLKLQTMIDNYCEHEHIPNKETAKAIEKAINNHGNKNEK